MRPVLLNLVLLFFSFSSLMAQNGSMPGLDAAIKALDNEADMVPANWGICVIDVNSGQVVSGINIHKNVVTASTMKSLTTASALAILGPDFRFKTLLQYDGKIDANGVLLGNIYIKGDGDPALGSDRFGEKYETATILNAWTRAIQAAGIKSINGKVIGDATIFTTQMTPGEWPWEDMGNYYGAGASGLNINENSYRIDLKPGSTVGSATEILRTEPPMSDIAFFNELTTGRVGSGDNAYIFGAPYTFVRHIRGTIPAGVASFSIKGSIPDPALYAAQWLTDELNKCGVVISQKASTMRLEKMAGTSTSNTRSTIQIHESPSLADIVYHTNMRSVNLFAEALAYRLAVKGGEKGSAEDAVEVMEAYWKNQGVNTRGMSIKDGSGLSPNNSLSTYQLASILRKAALASYSDDFIESLPLAGKSGSLSSMLRGTTAEGRLRAKSGFIAGVRGYAGIVDTVNGKKLAFAMISNNYACSAGQMRRKLETLMVSLADGK
ncbi:MAG: D-alanyl-D-alanine carboxypeptidase/D-alanyl-D-alanine-endopeptidase [Bacteroidetes bacterium]|nr:D-alanyl-D-alanine carboxypeptidase/D-alanyl-D-alanine-endopeptidase [Bacteroidota bacterium]